MIQHNYPSVSNIHAVIFLIAISDLFTAYPVFYVSPVRLITATEKNFVAKLAIIIRNNTNPQFIVLILWKKIVHILNWERRICQILVDPVRIGCIMISRRGWPGNPNNELWFFINRGKKDRGQEKVDIEPGFTVGAAIKSFQGITLLNSRVHINERNIASPCCVCFFFVRVPRMSHGAKETRVHRNTNFERKMWR